MLSDDALPANKSFEAARTCPRCAFYGAIGDGLVVCDRCAAYAGSLGQAYVLAAMRRGFTEVPVVVLHTCFANADLPSWLANLIADEIKRRNIRGDTLESEVR